MKIYGNTYQEKEPSPTEPSGIINEACIPITVNGKEMLFPLKSEDKIKNAVIKDNVLYVTCGDGKKYKLELED